MNSFMLIKSTMLKPLLSGFLIAGLLTSHGLVYAQDIQNSTDSSSLVSTPTISASPSVIPTEVIPSPTEEVSPQPTNVPTITAIPTTAQKQSTNKQNINFIEEFFSNIKNEPTKKIYSPSSYDKKAATVCAPIYNNHITVNFQPVFPILANNRLYMVDPATNEVKSAYVTGQMLNTWGGANPNGDAGPVVPGKFHYILNISADRHGNIYVVDRLGVQKFTSTGTYLATYATAKGTGDGQFDFELDGYYKSGIGFDSSDNMYIVDYGNHRIQKLSSTGTFIGKVGGQGSNAGQFTRPYDLEVDASNNIYVADTLNNRIQKFTSNLTFVTQWGGLGSNDGQTPGSFKGPYVVATGPDNKVYVSSFYYSWIDVFDTNGSFLSRMYTSAQGDDWRNIGINVPNNTVIVSDGVNSRIMFYKPGPRFGDVGCDHVFYQYIENLVEDSVVSGYPDGLFRPSTAVTRGAMAKFIKNAYGFADTTSCGNFPDVPTTHTFYKEITTLKCKGVISGYPDGTFKPEENVDRGAAMKFVMQGLRSSKGDANYLRYTGSAQRFSDVPTTNIFYEYIMAATETGVGIVSGYPDGTFKPTVTTDRGAMSKMVDNARKK